MEQATRGSEGVRGEQRADVVVAVDGEGLALAAQPRSGTPADASLPNPTTTRRDGVQVQCLCHSLLASMARRIFLHPGSILVSIPLSTYSAPLGRPAGP